MTIPLRPFASFALALASMAAGAPQAAPPAVPEPAPASPPSLSPAASRLRADVTSLASQEPKGRRTSSPEADRAADAIAERFRKLGLLPAGPKGSYLQSFRGISGADISSKSVLGLLPGADPKLNPEIVIVAARYDHRGPGGPSSRDRGADAKIHLGADDNASGTAALFEMARNFAERKPPLPRSLLFIAFGAEEVGILGSLPSTKNPTVPWASVVAMFAVDRVGHLRGDRLDVQGVGTSPAWKGLIESSNAGAKLKLALLDGVFGPPDHSPFCVAKKPVLFVFTGAHADTRRPSDTADKIDAAGIVRVVKFLEPIVAAVASAPNRIAFSEVKGGTPPGGGETLPDPTK